MLCETLEFSPKYPGATLTTYVSYDPPELKMPPRPALVVCPGGGYHFLSDREAEPIVKAFLAYGYNVFLLRYTVGEGAKNYAPLIQAALAVKLVRERAVDYHIDPARVFITGFSAGGHLAASTGILWNIPEVREALGDAPEGIAKPTGMILCYPVITGFTYAHRGSINNLCGKTDNTDEEIRRFSLEYHVDETTSPAFIWHTFNDKVVPVQNALLLADAMTRAKVPFELHIFPDGPHGLALCDKQTWAGNPAMLCPEAAKWVELAAAWMAKFPANSDSLPG